MSNIYGKQKEKPWEAEGGVKGSRRKSTKEGGEDFFWGGGEPKGKKKLLRGDVFRVNIYRACG